MTQVQKLAEDLFSSEAFLTVNKKLLQLYDPNHAVLISNLVDKYKYFASKDMLETQGGKEWFFLTYKKQQDQTGLSEYQVGRCLSQLEKDGVIESKREGVPAKKYYHMNFEVLLEMIEDLEDPRTSSLKTKELVPKKLGNKSPKNLGTIKDTKEGNHSKDTKEKNNKKSSPQSSRSKPPAKQRTKKYIPLAKLLAKVVRSHIDYKIDRTRIKSWARDLRLLHEQNGVHPKRMKKVLDWYQDNIGGDYIPQAFSGSTFREKFPKLEAAITRQEKSPASKGQKPATAYREKNSNYKDSDFKI